MGKNKKIAKSERGVTLFVLTITIVVLLILSATVVRNLGDSSIVNSTKNYIKEYSNDKMEEEDKVDNMVEKMDKNSQVEPKNDTTITSATSATTNTDKATN